jgi:hypothetical protein
MHLFVVMHQILGQLSTTISSLNTSLYTQPCLNLSNASIGQHTRHIIEMFQCLLAGYDQGHVNYENRTRDKRIESDPAFACQLLQQIHTDLNKENKPLLLKANFQDDADDAILLDTNFYREVAYNIEHAIHHMALIKVGILEISDLVLPAGFGVAPSTLKYNKACAQ